VLLVLLLLPGLFVSQAQAQTFTVLHAFQNKADGATPWGGVIVDQAGNLYGTTYSGGRYNYGTIYKIDPSGKMTVLHQFSKHDGCESYTPLLLDGAGNLYGTTVQCGSGHFGTAFELTKSNQLIVMNAFTGLTDGSDPWAGLIRDDAGNLYGSTRYNGPGGYGTVFKLDHQTKAETVLYSFGQPPDGEDPQAPLIRDAQGNLYGTTTLGGPDGVYGSGTVFKLDPSGNETILYTFTGGSDGNNPVGGVIRDAAGNLYGTTLYGGLGVGNGGWGIIFKLDPNGALTVLHNFGSFYGDGSTSYAGLIGDGQGNLYGTTSQGGLWGDGSVFKLADDGTMTILHSFTAGLDGGFPFSTLAMDSADNLYGTTTVGGISTGVVFKITP
jgi:uncharacterized repeat protein (TIGR03803 family)